MKDTKLIQILKTFTKEEIKNFEKFVASPYFSHGRDLTPFYKIMKSYYPDFENSKFTAEKIFSKLHPEEKFNKSKAENVLRVLSFELTKMAEEFLATEFARSNKFRERINLLDALIKKNLDKQFSNLFSDSLNNIDNLVEEYNGMHFADLYYFYMLDLKNNYNNNRADKGYIECNIYLLIYFFQCAGNLIDNSGKRKMNNNIVTDDDTVEHFTASIDFSNFISYLKNKKGIRKQDKDILEMCLYNYMLSIDKQNVTLADKTADLFYKYRHLFSDDTKLNFFTVLHNVYSEVNDKEKLYILYNKILDDDIFNPEKGHQISFVLYRLIIQNFTDLSKLTEAESFILRYTHFLNSDKKESFYNFGFALIEFKRNNFEKALGYVSKVEMIFLLFKYDIRNLYLMIYYKLEYSDEAYSLLDSYKHFLKNNKDVSDEKRELNDNFACYYRKLLSAKLSGNSSDLYETMKKLTDENKIVHKEWLLEQFSDLI
ncbi:MAG: hypothetical protein KDD00_15590 [Ignavibacteriae bacterium]|nr:hypothetical protein [Ignavibacteriota bacterium]